FFDFWMGDAWVVSSATLEFAGARFEKELPAGYPDTLGVEWDYSLVRVPVLDLPATTGLARLTIRDAAGNETVEEFTLSIDGTAPVAAFDAPAAGEIVSGFFDVVVAAYDAEPGPVIIELSAGGAPIATGIGPIATIT